ncbi:hypothetical protein RND61_10465 [Streptomyces sp. TRM76323]|uniref:Uncharacterized protein n=1 Tax=Streptomyces tamarix TaxID=3078565 RepID=A0ABU3QJ85_9ACTN|nr:hypothetical protein [Streptomyces tamarix]MDT9682489.1 hypothetical protein [Streptomyces tamarix]
MIEFLPDALIPMSDPAPITIPEVHRERWLYWMCMGPAAVGWLAAYAFAIHRGLKDKRVGIPPLLVAVNFAWEFNLSIVLDQDTTQRHTNFYWALFNSLIIYQTLKWGWKDFPKLTKRQFRAAFVGMFVWASLMVVVGTNELGDIPGVYTGTVINIPLSAAFIYMLHNRGSSAGQSMHIAVAKAIGSLFAGITVYIEFPGHYLFFVLFPTIHVLDIIYIRMLHRRIRAEGHSPWAFNRPPVPDPYEAAPASAPAAPAGPDTPADRAATGAEAAADRPATGAEAAR